MAIRFRCRSCRRLLSTGTRKAGHDIRCPICRQPQQVPLSPAPLAVGDAFQFPRPTGSPSTKGSQPGWALTWDIAFGLALLAGGIAIALFLCFVVGFSSANSRRTPVLPADESATTFPSKPVEVAPNPSTEKQVALVAEVVKPAAVPSAPSTKKPLAIVPGDAPKLPPPPGIAKVRAAPSLLLEEENRLLKAESNFWKAQAEQLAKEKTSCSKVDKSQKPIPVTREKLRFNVGSMHWPVVFKEDRKLGSQVRVLSQFLERLDEATGSQELVWAIKEALQALGRLRARLESYPITNLHANEAGNFLDAIETNLWALKRFI